MRVLLIEDNSDLAANVVDYLQGRKHVVDWASDGLSGLRQALADRPDVVVLDLGLPWMDGFELCRRLRRESAVPTPVLILTARDELESKLAGFEAGADDYLVKPFAMSELEARLRALIRRGSGCVKAGERLEVADLVLDSATLRVERAGKSVQLPPISLRLLARLMRETHRVVSRRELEQEIWGDDPPESDALRAHIHLLRAAIDRPFDRPLLHTVHGIGYRLAEPDALQA
jgi:DNA-binding response OmpR family regulator